MSKVILVEEELQEKIDSFLSRKNLQMQIREARAERRKAQLTAFHNHTLKLSF